MQSIKSLRGALLTAGLIVSVAVFAAGEEGTADGLKGLTGTPHAEAKHSEKSAHSPIVGRAGLQHCIEEHTQVAETFCRSNHNQCDAEKGGVRSECEAELRGQRHSG